MPNTTMTEARNALNEMGAQIRAAATALAAAANNPETPMEEITRQQSELRALNQRMNAMQAAYDAQYNESAGQLPPAPAPTPEQERSLHDMLKSNEYARAFTYALRGGVQRRRGAYDERCKVLFDALTIGGGDPVGEDGGFLVPEDIDRTIRERRRELSPLSEIFNVETTSTNSGWRVVDKAPTTGMTALTSEIPTGGIAQDDQPEFAKVPYSLTTYGLIVPVSNELMSDEVANLFTYLGNWFAKKQIITENLLLKAKLEALTASNITAADDPIGKVKSLLNKSLDPAISVLATILTNQDGYDYLDQLKDSDGRPMLQPDPTNATAMIFKGRRVKMVANSLLPSRTVTTTGATKGDYYPLYVGDFQQYATLFMRQNLEIVSTDIGGNAFRSNSVEVRGIARMGVSTFDTDAALHREFFLAASAS